MRMPRSVAFPGCGMRDDDPIVYEYSSEEDEALEVEAKRSSYELSSS